MWKCTPLICLFQKCKTAETHTRCRRLDCTRGSINPLRSYETYHISCHFNFSTFYRSESVRGGTARRRPSLFKVKRSKRKELRMKSDQTYRKFRTHAGKIRVVLYKERNARGSAVTGRSSTMGSCDEVHGFPITPRPTVFDSFSYHSTFVDSFQSLTC